MPPPRLWLLTAAFSLCLDRIAGAQSIDTASKGRVTASQQASAPACCSIVRIDADKLTITARETATGFTFRFAVRDKRLLADLKIGQPVWADFSAKTVRLKTATATPCCAILETQEKQ